MPRNGKGNCYDNAAMESFWSSAKNKGVYAAPETLPRSEAIAPTFDPVEGFYNRICLQNSLGTQSLVAFETLNN